MEEWTRMRVLGYVFLKDTDMHEFSRMLSRDEISKIVELLLNDLRKRLSAQEIELEVTPAAMEAIVAGGYDPVYGARPLKRYIQKMIETPLARKLLSGDVIKSIKVNYIDGAFICA